MSGVLIDSIEFVPAAVPLFQRLNYNQMIHTATLKFEIEIGSIECGV